MFLVLIKSDAQTIPYGNSQDSINIILYEDLNTVLPDFSATFQYPIYYYKPLNYDSLTSPIILFIHAQSGTGAQSANIQSIADSRNALIVAPTMNSNNQWAFLWDSKQDSNGCYHGYFIVNAITQIYNHVLQRENRLSVPVYLTGFSAGGQFTTRYMLLRQFIQDSIPIKMAVSVNPYSYTFCTDTMDSVSIHYTSPPLDTIIYNLQMGYPCGIWEGISLLSTGCSPNTIDTFSYSFFNCNEAIVQYYNENYGVLIGTADTVSFLYSPGWFCMDVQGPNRYARARNFYNFSDTNAITRGTTLQWKYDSVIGVDHNGYNMYNTKRNVTDTSTIAETLLFDTPWHPVPSLAPIASFTADTTIVSLPSAAVQFTNNSINATSYLWDFGDATTSTAISPAYIYTYPDTFTVKLTASSGTGCENTMLKRNYIIVKNAGGVSPISNLAYQISIHPNPNNGEMVINYFIPQNKKAEFSIYDLVGRKLNSYPLLGENNQLKISEKDLNGGIYYYEIISNGKKIKQDKIIVIK